MDIAALHRMGEWAWEMPMSGRMRVPGVIYASESLVRDMDEKVREQVANVASLPGIVQAAYAMPDAHWGYGFPIGGVAAFDPDEGGVISAGGVGFDISCGVRTLLTPLMASDIEPLRVKLAEALFRKVPAGVGSTSHLRLGDREMTEMLTDGAHWAVRAGYGQPADLGRIERHGRYEGADPSQVSGEARRRQCDEMGTLGSGNHYLEIQAVTEVYDEAAAAAFGLKIGGIVISIHCGSRGLGHQVATEFARRMVTSAAGHGIPLPDRELASVPIRSPVGRDYFGAMLAAANCALANREILTHFVREVFERVTGDGHLPLLYDVSHNVCSLETHAVAGRPREVYVHRKGATRAFGPGLADVPDDFKTIGQPVLIGGSMGTSSYILAGTTASESLAFSSACHGAGRSQSRSSALKQNRGEDVVERLRRRHITIKTQSLRGVAEEAPTAYKNVADVVDVTHAAGLARKVVRVDPLICVKG